MNDKKICFISCVSGDERDISIAENLSMLSVPEGFEIEYLGVREVDSIALGYNEAIDATDAMYKVFFKETLTISNPGLIQEILDIFSSDSKIDIIGICGTYKMPTDMIIQHGILYGEESSNSYAVDGAYQEVVCISDDLIVTKGDYQFTDLGVMNNTLYSIPLCAQAISQGKKIVVARQANAWVANMPIFTHSESIEKAHFLAKEKYSSVFNIDKSAKRLGVVQLQEMSANDIIWALLQTRHDVEIVDLNTSIYSCTDEDVSKLTNFIRTHHIDALFTFDFCQAVSKACEICGCKYISWIYDAPQQALFTDEVKNSCNYIFDFDKKQSEITKKLGGIHVYHQNLATNITRTSMVQITPQDQERFACDISFIGSLYSENEYNKIVTRLSVSEKAALDDFISTAFGIWDGKAHIQGHIPQNLLNACIDVLNAHDNPIAKYDPQMYIDAILISRRLANLERTQILKELAGHNIKFYTRDKNVEIDGITVSPPLDYQEELPKAYALSKINLNITLHSITSGIPLRVFDIMSSGGFVLSNFQPEIGEFFSPGREIETYQSIPELKEKVAYYLSHEDKRKTIALNGYKKVSEKYSYEKCIGKMLHLSGIN